MAPVTPVRPECLALAESTLSFASGTLKAETVSAPKTRVIVKVVGVLSTTGPSLICIPALPPSLNGEPKGQKTSPDEKNNYMGFNRGGFRNQPISNLYL
jgi:hypothetical protein